MAIFILELIVGIGGYLLKNKTEEVLSETLDKTMQKYATQNSSENTALWDLMQDEVRIAYFFHKARSRFKLYFSSVAAV